ncbi:DUF3617 domain-containing protein [Sphingosinicella sp. CPCC 101087]|uniref:DUF3617 domain-containing protein n=1 Tax=Sphingosinicella sp. CPCC 101087 TaxID=2497754 RepID=UPI00101CDE5A|nr:DUF3617 domain-containing protein [Sphingosinicella sp. CPCC 101087]
MRPLAALFAAAGLVAAGCGGEVARNMTGEEVADELSDMQIEPGLWELTSEVVEVSAPGLPREVRNRMVGPRSRIRNCISPQQASRPGANFLAMQSDSACTYRDFSVRGGEMRGTMVCPEAVASMSGQYRPESYELRMAMESPMPGGATMTLQLRARGSRIGDCPEEKAG